MVIECRHVWNYISEYLDGALPEATRDTVQGIWSTARFVPRSWIRRATSSSSRQMTASSSCPLASVNVSMHGSLWN